MTLAIGAQALGRAWRRMMRHGAMPFSRAHLDIGAGEEIDDGRPGHPHHMRQDHQQQREGGQGAAIDMLGECRVRIDGREGREEMGAGDEEQHEDIGDEELRRGDRREGGHVYQPVEDRIPVKGGQHAEDESERHGDDRRHGGEEERVLEPGCDQRDHGAGIAVAVGKGGPEIAMALLPIQLT